MGVLIFGTNNPKQATRIEEVLYHYGVKYKEQHKFVENLKWSGFFRISSEPVCKYLEEKIRRDIKELERPKAYRRPDEFGASYLQHL